MAVSSVYCILEMTQMEYCFCCYMTDYLYCIRRIELLIFMYSFAKLDTDLFSSFDHVTHTNVELDKTGSRQRRH